MKSLKANVLCTLGIALAIFSVGCGDAIQKSQSTAAMFGYVFLSCGFLTTPTSGGMHSEMPDVR